MSSCAEFRSVNIVQRNFRHMYVKHAGNDSTTKILFVRFKETEVALRQASGTLYI
jgi:hypothetical protein